MAAHVFTLYVLIDSFYFLDIYVNIRTVDRVIQFS